MDRNVKSIEVLNSWVHCISGREYTNVNITYESGGLQKVCMTEKELKGLKKTLDL